MSIKIDEEKLSNIAEVLTKKGKLCNNDYIRVLISDVGSAMLVGNNDSRTTAITITKLLTHTVPDDTFDSKDKNAVYSIVKEILDNCDKI